MRRWKLCAVLVISLSNFAGVARAESRCCTRQTVRKIMLREKSGATKRQARNVRPEFEIESLFNAWKTAKTESAIGPKTSFVVNAPIVTGTSFIAAQYGDSGSVPPDCIGDIGPAQFLLCINGRIRTFNRSGNADGVLDSTTSNFFNSVRGTGDTADPRVRYDRM